jgi:hypothetical protein
MLQHSAKISHVVYLFQKAAIRIKNHNARSMLGNRAASIQNPVEEQRFKAASVQDFFYYVTPELIC